MISNPQTHKSNTSSLMSEDTDRRFYRNGKNHRFGWIVDFADVKKTFGFSTFRLGKWVTEEEKIQSAPLFYDALQDLNDILNGTAELISLRGTLSLDYGIGGQVGTYAHYTPANRCFSLAKNAGPGSIAHEWFHAFDHYISTKMFESASDSVFASDAWSAKLKIHDHPLNQLLITCFEAILLDETKEKNSQLVLTSKIADAKNGERYYSLPVELCARSFEAYIQDSEIKNNFLVKGTKKSEEAKQGLYPVGNHRKRINKAFSVYFNTLGKYLRRSTTSSDGMTSGHDLNHGLISGDNIELSRQKASA